jgi:hypothetical protein
MNIQPGLYKLCRTVTNPRPDHTIKSHFLYVPNWRNGIVIKIDITQNGITRARTQRLEGEITHEHREQWNTILPHLRHLKDQDLRVTTILWDLCGDIHEHSTDILRLLIFHKLITFDQLKFACQLFRDTHDQEWAKIDRTV